MLLVLIHMIWLLLLGAAWVCDICCFTFFVALLKVPQTLLLWYEVFPDTEYDYLIYHRNNHLIIIIFIECRNAAQCCDRLLQWLKECIFRYRDEYRDRDYRRRSRSRSRDRYDCDRYRGRERDHRRRSRSRSASPDRHKYHGRGKYDEERRSRSRSYERYYKFLLFIPFLIIDCMFEHTVLLKIASSWSASPTGHSPNSKRSPSPHKTHKGEIPDGHNRNERSPALKCVSPDGRRSVSRSLSPRRSPANVSL